MSVKSEAGGTRIPHIVFGEGCSERIGELVAPMGRCVLLVTGRRSLRAGPHRDRILARLREAGCSVREASVPPEPSPEVVDEIVNTHAGCGVEAVVGLGGGSAIDAAKVVAALLPHGSSAWDHLEGVGRGRPYHGPALPVVAVPTTAGTGSEVTRNAVLTRRGAGGFKRSMRHDALLPRLAVVDPDLTAGCPPAVAAAAWMDAFTQLVEAYVSPRADPCSDAVAWAGLESIREGLFAPNAPRRARNRAMARAATLSGIALTRAGLGVVHGLASVLGARYGVPHGVACGTLLASATQVNVTVLETRGGPVDALSRYAAIGRLVAGRADLSDAAAREALVEETRALAERLRIPDPEAFGITAKDAPEIASEASLKNNPVELSRAEVEDVLLQRIGVRGG